MHRVFNNRDDQHEDRIKAEDDGRLDFSIGGTTFEISLAEEFTFGCGHRGSERLGHQNLMSFEISWRSKKALWFAILESLASQVREEATQACQHSRI